MSRGSPWTNRIDPLHQVVIIRSSRYLNEWVLVEALVRLIAPVGVVMQHPAEAAALHLQHTVQDVVVHFRTQVLYRHHLRRPKPRGPSTVGFERRQRFKTSGRFKPKNLP
eukprot:4762365-Pyramimonas_sp.AAC.1